MAATSSGCGAWGNALTQTIGQIDAILSRTLTLQSSAAMNVTLSSSQAQCARIVVKGNLPGDFILTFPSSNFALCEYTVSNNSSAGSGGVLCQTPSSLSGSVVKVNRGAMRQIYVDGINVRVDLQPIGSQAPYGSSAPALS
jgi:hypothetical protein